MMQAGGFIGQKVILNEFVAFMDFASVKEQLSKHSQVIITSPYVALQILDQSLSN